MECDYKKADVLINWKLTIKIHRYWPRKYWRGSFKNIFDSTYDRKDKTVELFYTIKWVFTKTLIITSLELWYVRSRRLWHFLALFDSDQRKKNSKPFYFQILFCILIPWSILTYSWNLPNIPHCPIYKLPIRKTSTFPVLSNVWCLIYK